MNLRRRFLLSIAVLGLQIGLAAAADPTLTRVQALVTSDAAPTAVQAPVVVDTGNVSESVTAERSGVIAGVGLYLLQPHYQSNRGYAVEAENQDGAKPTFHIVERMDVSHHMQASPLVWLGYIGESGFGGRARYWYFREGTNQTLAFPPSTGPVLFTIFSATPLGLEAFGDTFFKPNQNQPGVFEPTIATITSKLEFQVADLEVLQDVKTGNWDFLFSGGIRLARIAQTYNFYNLQPLAQPFAFRNLLSSYNFEGAGPVLAVEARRRIGRSGFALFGNARGSMVFGSAQQNVLFGGNRLRNPEDPNPQVAFEHRTRGIPVAELEIGLEYGRPVGRSWAFGQIGLVGQDWLGAGNASRSSPASFKEGPPLAGSSYDSDIGMFGLSCRLGLNY